MNIKNIKEKISKEIFRAYDIRGVVEKSLTEDITYTIGKAIGTKVQRLGGNCVVVGRDGRLSGLRLFQALSKGILASGCDVLDLGQVPSPVVYFANHHLNLPFAVVITGSHNPPEYNGLKIVMNFIALWGEAIQEFYHLIQTEDFLEGNGELKTYDIANEYIEYIRNTVSLSRPLKVVIDSGNGVTGNIAPKLYQALGCEVVPLFCEIDGRFPNHHPDPGQPKNLTVLQEKVLVEKADLGLAFDGDGDRLGTVDSLGNIIWPDRLLILFAADILTRHPKAEILYDVKCSRHVALTIEKLGGTAFMWKTGHSLIKAKMKETGALLGGEMSGHLFFKERWFGFDDALYAGARLLELFANEKTDLSSHDWFAKLPNSQNTPELQLLIAEDQKFSSVEKLIETACFDDAKINTIDGLRVDFEDGFGLVRPSNTSSNLILRFEGDTVQALTRIQEKFRQLLLSVEPNWQLPF
jgi:phosphomannomutase / phosphoglucomutase